METIKTKYMPISYDHLQNDKLIILLMCHLLKYRQRSRLFLNYLKKNSFRCYRHLYANNKQTLVCKIMDKGKLVI